MFIAGKDRIEHLPHGPAAGLRFRTMDVTLDIRREDNPCQTDLSIIAMLAGSCREDRLFKHCRGVNGPCRCEWSVNHPAIYGGNAGSFFAILELGSTAK